MNGFFSPDVVLAVIATASFAVALAAAAVLLAVRQSRRRAAGRALATTCVPDAATAMSGEPYRALTHGLTEAMEAGRR